MTDIITTFPPEELGEEVLEVLESQIYPADYLTNGTAVAYSHAIDTIFETCFTDTDTEVDLAQYNVELEGLVWGLMRQRDLLFAALEANHLYAKADGIGQLIKDLGPDLFKKMVLYAAGKLDAAQSDQSRRFYDMKSFHAACEMAKLLPPEWQERGAKFVEVYSANYFETEFKGQKL